MFKFSVLLVLAVNSVTSVYHDGIPFEYGTAYAPTYDNYKPHDYHFNYGVSDPHTGDHKSQWETKENGVVRGAYSLLEPDGTTRVVEYIADDNGFRAVVKKIGTPYHNIPHHQESPKILVPEQPQIVVPQEPVYHQYNAYDGQLNNYQDQLNNYEQYLLPTQEYNTPTYQVQKVPEPVYKTAEPHVTVEYHGFTGNDEDDSRYTKYDDNEGDRGGYYYGNQHVEESKPQQLYTVPFNFQPLPYQYVFNHY